MKSPRETTSSSHDPTRDDDRPLDGVTILDFCMMGPGLFAARLLARLGARVIHFEPPGGDPARQSPEMQRALNGGKESVVADLATPEGRALALGAIRRADVLLEGWRPGVAERLGVGWEETREVNPRLVYCSLSGYGRSGPLRGRAGHDINYLAVSGLMRVLSGDGPPSDAPIPLGDIAAASFAATRTLAALLRTQATGRGVFVDVSIAGSSREWVEGTAAESGAPPVAFFRTLPHYGVYETKDKEHLTFGVVHETHFWRNLCAALGREEWAELTLFERAARAAELREETARIVRERSRAEWEAVLAGVDTCWAFVERPATAPEIGGRPPRSDDSVAALGEHTERLRREIEDDEPTSTTALAGRSAG